MRVLLQGGRLILVPEGEDETLALAAWRAGHDNYVFAMVANAGSGATLSGLGRREEACREPINITSTSPEPFFWISNFAPTPFVLDGVTYACVEAFWQSLRAPPAERPRIANLDGAAAKREGAQYPYCETIRYDGRAVPTGAFDHWTLMRRACVAKFQQNTLARDALLGTGERPLTHIVRRDSHTIPGVILVEIWIAIRKLLRA